VGTRLVQVGVGALAVGSHPERLMTPALGSCVGVSVWDGVRQSGGLAHVMLPSPGATAASPESARFASWAVPEMVRLLLESGSKRRSLTAKIAGGAAMFRGDAAVAQIGNRNIIEVRRQLELAGITVEAEDTGGSHARSVELLLDSGVLLVRSYQFGMRLL
jgi:chemotaxis protein CheD